MHPEDRRDPVGRAPRERTGAVPTLWVTAGPDMLRHVVISAAEDVVIGRDDGASLVLDDASVSRRHARVRQEADGALWVEDLASTNGTAVNGEPVGRGELRAGDRVELGSVPFRLDWMTADEHDHLVRARTRTSSSPDGLLPASWLDDTLPGLLAACGDRVACLAVSVSGVVPEARAELARVWAAHLRDEDAGVWIGAFALVFLPGADAGDAAAVADRLTRAVATHEWSRSAPDGPPATATVVSARRPGEDAAAWVARIRGSLAADDAAPAG
jgi:hypothetical protein